MGKDETINTTKVEASRDEVNNIRAKRKKAEEGFSTARKIITAVGAIATVALAICPFDGPVGEIVSAIATGGLLVVTEAVEAIVLSTMKVADKEEPAMKNDEIDDIAAKGKGAVGFLKELADLFKKLPKKDKKQYSSYSYQAPVDDEPIKEGHSK